MSYSRFGAKDSDVYVFLSVGSDSRPGGWLECCSCLLQPEVGDSGFHEHTRVTTTAEMLRHLEHHQQAGHIVPASCIQALLHDQVDNDEHMGAGEYLEHSTGWLG